jgi:hypothetical protein
MTEIAFCNRYNMSTVFSKSTKYGFKMQAAWRSPNRLPTMVHGQAFCIITRKDNREGICPIRRLGTRLTGVLIEIYDSSPVPRKLAEKEMSY